jgi:hypothetical protein
MAALACITLAALVSFPQGDGGQAELSSVLSTADKKSLNKRAQDWIKAEFDYEANSRLRKRRDQAKTKFLTDFRKKGKSDDNVLLKHMGDLLAIFDKAFPYTKPKGSTPGVLKKFDYETEDATFEYHLLAPRGYAAKNSYRSVLVLAGQEDAAPDSDWAESRDYYEQLWKGSKAEKESIFVFPSMIVGDDYDTTPDLTSDLGQQNEIARISGVLSPFGEVKRTYRMDRSRTLLDCGVGNSGFGIRLATYFPSQFAGLILRQPKAPGRLRLGGLRGMPVLLIDDGESREACEEIKDALDRIQAGKALIIDGTAENLNEQIDTWLLAQVRPNFPIEVTIAPNHDSFKKSHWAQIISCEPLDSVSDADRPVINVKADRSKNQIVITSTNVTEIGLYLNDRLVDLDKPVEIVVNGESMEATQFQRSMNTLVDYMRIRAYDPTALYTAYHRFEVAKSK